MNESRQSLTANDVKNLRREAKKMLREQNDLSYCQCQDVLAQKHGFRNWSLLLRAVAKTPAQKQTAEACAVSGEPVDQPAKVQSEWFDGDQGVAVNMHRDVYSVLGSSGKKPLLLWYDLLRQLKLSPGIQHVKIEKTDRRSRPAIETLVAAGLLKQIKNTSERYYIPRSMAFLSRETPWNEVIKSGF